MHRVLSIPELLDVAFTYADQSTLAAAARTTKTWSEPALDKLWMNLPSLLPLVRLLGKTHLVPRSGEAEEDGDGGDGYDGMVWALHDTLPEDWARFPVMSKRVKSLKYNDNSVDGVPPTAIATKVFDQLAYRRIGALLPHLQCLEWHASQPETIGHLFLFLSPSLRLIDINISNTSGSTFNPPIERVLPFFQDRCPSLEELSLRMFTPVGLVQESLVKLFSTIKSIKRVNLPLLYLSKRILQSLGELPNLEYLGQSPVAAASSRLPPVHIHQISPNQFQQLRFLVFDASMQEAAEFLRNPNRPRLLETWGITTWKRGPATAQEIDDVLNLIAIHYPNIRHLIINILCHRVLEFSSLSYDSIMLLLPCRELTGLEIVCNHPIRLSQDQVVEMGNSWPSMTILDFSSQSVTVPQSPMSGIPLDLLPVIFTSFCNLESLSLYLDPSASPSSHPLSSPAPPMLKKLGLGSSQIAREHIYHTAAFLSELLTDDVEITFEVSEMLKDGLFPPSPRFYFENMEREKRWTEVGQMIKMLVGYKVRIEARHQVELKSSRERIMELEDRFVKV